MLETTNIFDIGKDFKVLAIERIDNESKEYKGGKYGQVVYTYVANALREFCRQNELFAEAVVKTKRGFSDCVNTIMKGCGNSISDIEVYRRAAKFFFPDSEVEFLMTIKLGEFPKEKYLLKEPQKKTEHKTKPKKEKATSKPKSNNTNVIQLSLFGGD